jgi:hypothetical protein
MTWKEDPGSRELPALAGHSLTLVGDTQLYVIGGMSLRHYYSEDELLLDVAANQWHVIQPVEGTGAKQVTSPPPSPSGEVNRGTKPTGTQVYVVNVCKCSYLWSYIPVSSEDLTYMVILSQ